jgi:large subunit ribosomal protein L6
MYFKELIIPENVNVEIIGNKVKVSGPKGELEKSLKIPEEIKVEKIENKIKVYSESERRKIKALIGTIAAHIRNMLNGVTKGFSYRLRMVYSHFPISVKVEKDKILIQNFLGEKKPRIAKIVGNVEVKVEGSDIIISGIDLDSVGQTAGNLEQATRITGYDRRRFMDGIWIVSRSKR